jgi:DNA-binding MarR family transcriptional regulator
MLHYMRSIHPPAPGLATESASVDAIVAEVGAWMSQLRCGSMGRLVQSHVSMSHLHVLWLLQHHGAMPMSRLAELIDVSLSNATGLIDRMEERGLVERVRVPDDRRVVLVQPAAAGRAALSEKAARGDEQMRNVISRLKGPERTVVLAAFQSLRRALSEVEPAPGSPAHHHHFGDIAN